MPTLTKRISTYSINIDLYTGWNFSSDASNVDFDQWIYCKAADGTVVRLFFLTNREQPPKSFVASSSDRWYMFFKKDQYVYCLDLLRNEMPVWAGLDPDKGKAILKSGSEPVGEGPGEL